MNTGNARRQQTDDKGDFAVQRVFGAPLSMEMVRVLHVRDHTHYAVIDRTYLACLNAVSDLTRCK